MLSMSRSSRNIKCVVQGTGSVHLTLIVGIKTYTDVRFPQGIESISKS